MDIVLTCSSKRDDHCQWEWPVKAKAPSSYTVSFYGRFHCLHCPLLKWCLWHWGPKIKGAQGCNELAGRLLYYLRTHNLFPGVNIPSSF